MFRRPGRRADQQVRGQERQGRRLRSRMSGRNASRSERHQDRAGTRLTPAALHRAARTKIDLPSATRIFASARSRSRKPRRRRRKKAPRRTTPQRACDRRASLPEEPAGRPAHPAHRSQDRRALVPRRRGIPRQEIAKAQTLGRRELQVSALLRLARGAPPARLFGVRDERPVNLYAVAVAEHRVSATTACRKSLLVRAPVSDLRIAPGNPDSLIACSTVVPGDRSVITACSSACA